MATTGSVAIPDIGGISRALAAMTDGEMASLQRALAATRAMSGPSVALVSWRRRCRIRGLGLYGLPAIRAAVRAVGSLDALRSVHQPGPGRGTMDTPQMLRQARELGLLPPTPRGS